jgi:hypothetical protein
MFYVYGLIDPITKELRYIGKTKNIKIRYRDHLRGLNEKNHKANWIKGLLKNNLKPEIIIIEENESEKECFSSEIFYIEYFKCIGARLTNLTLGGEGASVHRMSDEIRKKISLSHTGKKHTDETKQKIRKIRTGTKASEETRKKMSEGRKGEKSPSYGVKKTDEQKIKISKGRKGKMVGKDNHLYGKKRDPQITMKSTLNNKNNKLTFEQTDEIRKLYFSGQFKQKELAKMYGVSRPHISAIVNYKRGIIHIKNKIGI